MYKLDRGRALPEAKNFLPTNHLKTIVLVCFSLDGVEHRCIPAIICLFCVIFKLEIEPGT